MKRIQLAGLPALLLLFFAHSMGMNGHYRFQVKVDIKPLERYILKGLVRTHPDSDAFAVFYDKKNQRDFFVREGGSIGDFRLFRIEKNCIILKRGEVISRIFPDGTLRMDFRATQIDQMEEPSNDKYAQYPFPGRSAGLKVIARQFIRENILERLAGEKTLIFRKIGLSPELCEDNIRGCRITHMPGGTLLSEIGLHRNDIILELNGLTTVGPQTLLSLFRIIEESDGLDITLSRNDRLIQIRCTILDQ